MKKQHQVIIIGGGIAGLSCAHRLAAQGIDFLLITENIGGRLHQHNGVQMGAYYLAKESRLKEFAIVTRKMTPGTLQYHTGKQIRSMYELLLHPRAFFRLLLLLKKFRTQYYQFQKKCLLQSQKAALEKNVFLSKLYRQNGASLMKEYRLEKIEEILASIVRTSVSAELRHVNAFVTLQCLLPMISPVYEFVFDFEKLISSFRKKIILSSAKKITHRKHWEVRTQNKTFRAQYLVLATPAKITRQLLHMKKVKEGVNAYTFHVKGIMKQQFSKRPGNMFSEKSAILGSMRQLDGTFIVLAKTAKPDLTALFTHYKVLYHTHWEPAFYVLSNEMQECSPQKGLYVIGDYNICGLEDAFITGIYAADDIVRKKTLV